MDGNNGNAAQILIPGGDDRRYLHASYRFCVDYRKVNAVTERDAYPLPLVTATLDKLRGARFLSSIDIKSAYWHIPVRKDSRPMTAFTVPGRGLFEFCRMPFGLHNAPATWQRFIDRVLGADMEPYVFVYLDDIVIVSSDFDKHLDVLKEVFRRLSKAGLRVSREKCQLCRSELRFLGYVVDAKGLRVDPGKVEAIVNFAVPKSVREVRRFHGMASWYRRFIPGFSSIVAPITNLLRKNQKFHWSDDCMTSFERLKECLVSAPILSCPDFEREFFVQTDASDYGLGGVLYQVDQHGEHVVAYVSRSLSGSERKFSATEKECLAVLFAVNKFRPYIEGTRFTVVTDHYSLKWLNTLKDPSGRLARWSVQLQQFDFQVVHRRGKDNVVPDALSRAVPVVNSITATGDRWYDRLMSGIRERPLAYPLFRVEENKLFKKTRTAFPELDGQSYTWKLVVPKDQRPDILHKFHDDVFAGHGGVFKTFSRIAEKFYWPKMRSDIARYVKCCRICLASKVDNKPPAGQLAGRPEVKRPWQMICVDLVGRLPRSTQGHEYILTVEDYFSKFILLFPLRKSVAKTIVKLLEEEVFCMFGVPEVIVCDNGKQFVAGVFKSLADTYGIKIKHTSLYHPQANAVERRHRTLNTVLRSYISDNHRRWDRDLQKVACCLRTSRHEVTNRTPYYINFGREISLDGRPQPVPSEGETRGSDGATPNRDEGFRKLYADVRQRLTNAFERSRATYNLRHRDVQFMVGQRVWRRNFALSDGAAYITAKFLPKYLGPYIIRRRLNPWNYELEDLQGTSCGIWNLKDLKEDPDISPAQ